MMRSMTGFGKAEASLNGKKISIELRALNSKSMDLNLRLPNGYKELDNDFRKIITGDLVRGKVDCSLSIESTISSESASINSQLAGKYIAELKSLAAEHALPESEILATVLRLPDVVDVAKSELSDEEKKSCLAVLQAATKELNAFRDREGGQLYEEFSARINDIRVALDQVPQYESVRVELVRERMRKALEDLGNYDENRFEQELIFYIEKMDISEEKMRLANHLDYFMETMKDQEAGKKLGFISQEIGREINTLGSKSYHAELQKLVIGMKDALEKIKEQILNTL